MSKLQNHPKEWSDCFSCGAADPDWQPKRSFPQIGQTYECGDCGQEVYRYDITEEPNQGERYTFKPVHRGIIIGLRFFEIAEDWPDPVTADLMKQGCDRMEAIDYHIVEREGLSQSEWSRRTDRSQQAVSENVRKAARKLN